MPRSTLSFHKLLLFVVFSCLTSGFAGGAHAEPRPNIVVIIGEDMGPDLGCWGVNIHTPNIDRLASEGMRFTHFFGTASVCMPNRTAMITGVTQSTLGSITMRPPERFQPSLPEGVKPLPELLRELGYLTANIKDQAIGSTGKDDWNFRYEKKRWDTHSLEDLNDDKPFYAQFNFKMPHRPYRQDKENPVDPGTVELPPYYPDHPVARQSWSDYLESIQNLDRNVGRVITHLQANKLWDKTIVIFVSDHGEAMLRGKYFLYDCSLNQPLIIRWPENLNRPADYKAGGTNREMHASIDLPAQTLACAGAEIPQWMHGQAMLGPGSEGREDIYSAADWYGGGRLKSRSIRTERYKYIRNFNTWDSVLSASTNYRKAMHPMYHLIPILDQRGELSDLHQKLLLTPLPDEELYDLKEDPHEINNLALKPDHSHTLKTLRTTLEERIITTGDRGFEPLAAEHVAYFRLYREQGRQQFAEKIKSLAQQVQAEVQAADKPRKQ